MNSIPLPLRAAQPGDICILLEPNDPDEIAALQQHQLALQHRYGGRVMNPVHVTSQRFTITHPQQIQALLDQLAGLAAQWQPFQISANGLLPLNSEYHQARIIKWKIAPPDALVRFSAHLERVLAAIGGDSLYPPGWVSDLVTALTGIDPAASPEEHDLHLTQPLFTPNILALSRINGPTEFEVLEKIPLWTSSP